MAFDLLVKKEATVDDTLQLIINAINVCSRSPFVREVVREISRQHDPVTDKPGFVKALFDWACRNGKYQLDIPGIEEVWTPELTTRMQRFDCKKITVLICSVLKAAGIDPIAKHVYYSGPDGSLENFTHIYTIVPASSLHGPGAHTMEFVLDPYITVDPTNDCKYNAEVQHSKSTLYFLNGKKMELHMMGKAANIQPPVSTMPVDTSSFTSQINQTACNVEDTMRAICCLPSTSMCGPADYRVDYIGLKAKDDSGNTLFEYTLAEGAAHTAAILTLAPSRGALLGLLYLGKLLAKTPIKIYLATRLAKAWQINKSKVRKTWWMLGGTKEAKALQTAIIKGSGISIGGPYGWGYDYPGIYRPGINGATIGEPVTLATAGAAIAIATPALVAIRAMMKSLGVFKEGDTDPIPPEGTEPPPPPPPPGGGTTPPGGGPPPAAGSFATHSIDTFNDLANFLKAAGVILLAASLHPVLIVPTNILLVVSFIYAVRKHFKK